MYACIIVVLNVVYDVVLVLKVFVLLMRMCACACGLCLLCFMFVCCRALCSVFYELRIPLYDLLMLCMSGYYVCVCVLCDVCLRLFVCFAFLLHEFDDCLYVCAVFV